MPSFKPKISSLLLIFLFGFSLPGWAQAVRSPYEVIGLKNPQTNQELYRLSDQQVLSAFKKLFDKALIQSEGEPSMMMADVNSILDAYNEIKTVELREQHFLKLQSTGHIEFEKNKKQPIKINSSLANAFGISQSINLLDQEEQKKSISIIEENQMMTRSQKVGLSGKVIFEQGNYQWKWKFDDLSDIHFERFTPPLFTSEVLKVKSHQRWIANWIEEDAFLKEYRFELASKRYELEKEFKLNPVAENIDPLARVSKISRALRQWHQEQMRPYLDEKKGDFDSFLPEQERNQFWDLAERFSPFSLYVKDAYLDPILDHTIAELVIQALDFKNPDLFKNDPKPFESSVGQIRELYHEGVFDSFLHQFKIESSHEKDFFVELSNFINFNASMNPYFTEHLLRYNVLEVIERSDYYLTTLRAQKESSLSVLRRFFLWEAKRYPERGEIIAYEKYWQIKKISHDAKGDPEKLTQLVKNKNDYWRLVDLDRNIPNIPRVLKKFLKQSNLDVIPNELQSQLQIGRSLSRACNFLMSGWYQKRKW